MNSQNRCQECGTPLAEESTETLCSTCSQDSHSFFNQNQHDQYKLKGRPSPSLFFIKTQDPEPEFKLKFDRSGGPQISPSLFHSLEHPHQERPITPSPDTLLAEMSSTQNSFLQEELQPIEWEQKPTVGLYIFPTEISPWSPTNKPPTEPSESSSPPFSQSESYPSEEPFSRQPTPGSDVGIASQFFPFGLARRSFFFGREPGPRFQLRPEMLRTTWSSITKGKASPNPFPSVVVYGQNLSSNPPTPYAGYLDIHGEAFIQTWNQPLAGILYVKNSTLLWRKHDVLVGLNAGGILRNRLFKNAKGLVLYTENRPKLFTIQGFPQKVYDREYSRTYQSSYLVDLAFAPDGKLYCSVLPNTKINAKYQPKPAIYRLEPGTNQLLSKKIFEIPFSTWGGHFSFHPNGYLYISTGDTSLNGRIYSTSYHISKSHQTFFQQQIFEDPNGPIFGFRFITDSQILYASKGLTKNKEAIIKGIQFSPNPLSSPTTYIHNILKNTEIFGLSSAVISSAVIQIQDYIGASWKNSFLQFVSPLSGDDENKTIFLISETKKDSVIGQYSEGKISFILRDLAPLEKKVFSILPALSQASKPYTTNIAETDKSKKTATFSTNKFEITFPIGEFRKEREEVKPPITQMKSKLFTSSSSIYSKTTIFGESSFYGEVPLSLKSELVANGLIYAKIKMVYEYNHYTLTLTAQLAVNDSQVFWTQNIEKKEGWTTEQPGSGWRILLSKQLSSLALQYQPESANNFDPNLVKNGYIPLLNQLSVDRMTSPKEKNPKKIADIVALTPWKDWFDGKTQIQWTFQTTNYYGSFTPYDFFQVTSLSPSVWVTPLPENDIWSEEQLKQKEKEDDQKRKERKQKQLFLQADVEPASNLMTNVFISINNYSGQREWCFGNPEQGLSHKLNQVKELDLLPKWIPTPTYEENLLYVDRKELEQYQKANNPKDFESLAKTAKFRWEQTIHSYNNMKDGARNAINYCINVPNLTKQDEVNSHILNYFTYFLKEAVSVEFIQLFGTLKNTQRNFSFSATGDLPLLSSLADIALRTKSFADLDQKEKNKIKAQMAYFSYQINSSALWSDQRMYSSGSLRMVIFFARSRLALAQLLKNHPQYKKWRSNGLFSFYSILNGIGKRGETHETSHYSIASIDEKFYIMRAFRHENEILQKSIPKVTLYVQYLMNHFTPRDARFYPTGSSKPIRAMNSYARSYVAERYFWAGAHATFFEKLAQKQKKTHFLKLAKLLKYLWEESGSPTYSTGTNFNTGFETLFTQNLLAPWKPQDSPNQTPSLLRSQQNKNYTIFNHGFSTPYQHQMFFLNTQYGFAPTGTSSIKGIFAFGKPISFITATGVLNSDISAYPTYLRVTPLQSRVMASRNWLGVKNNKIVIFDRNRSGGEPPTSKELSFSTLPFQDYFYHKFYIFGSTETPTTNQFMYPNNVNKNWPTRLTKLGNQKYATGGIYPERQLIFIKDSIRQGNTLIENPTGIHYYVFRDTISEAQPTEWTNWTLSQGLGISGTDPTLPVAKRLFPDGKTLPKGQRYTAIGQYSDDPNETTPYTWSQGQRIDIEYYVASPTNTPRNTVRWGTTKLPLAYGNLNVKTDYFQDALHLQLPGKGHYFVALFLRRKNLKVKKEDLQIHSIPKFQTMGSEKVIKIEGKSNKTSYADYVYLSHTYGTVKATHNNKILTFSGESASFLQRNKVTILNLGKAKPNDKDPNPLTSVELKDSYMLECHSSVSMYADDSGVLIQTSPDFDVTHSISFRVPPDKKSLRNQNPLAAYSSYDSTTKTYTLKLKNSLVDGEPVVIALKY